MGIDDDGMKFLRAARGVVNFERTCTIGRQALSLNLPGCSDRYAENLFRELGARTLDVLDYSDYEGASILHDLNREDVPAVIEPYTLVIDGGSLEHVFHVPNALRSIMSMVAPGGHVLFMNPADGHSGHGFYQFSPEFYYRVLSAENGFRVTQCLFKEYGRHQWFAVPDPADVGHRILLTARSTAYLYVIAERRAITPFFTTPPLQSDYLSEWESNGAQRRSRLDALPAPLRRRARDAILFVRRRQGPRGAGLKPVRL